MRHLHSDDRFSLLFVRCVLRNQHGTKTLDLSSALLHRIGHLRAQYLVSENLYQSERQAERKALLDMFEIVFAKQPSRLRDMLTRLTDED